MRGLKRCQGLAAVPTAASVDLTRREIGPIEKNLNFEFAAPGCGNRRRRAFCCDGRRCTEQNRQARSETAENLERGFRGALGRDTVVCSGQDVAPRATRCKLSRCRSENSV